MSFQIYKIFKIYFVFFLSFSENVRGDYANNPFFQSGVQNSTTEKASTTLPTVVVSITQSTPQKQPNFTVEPPKIVNVDELRKKCLQARGQFPSSFCNRYVNCWDGIVVEQSCPDGFLFNPTKLYCDFPENVDCKGKQILLQPVSLPVSGTGGGDTPSSSNLLPPQSGASNSVSSAINPSLRKLCWKSTGLFPGSTCDKFVNCWDNNVVELSCPSGLYFNPGGYCDYPENVFCGKPDDVKQNPAKELGRDINCPLESGYFRNRNNCSLYYVCSFYKVVANHTCPEGLSFSDILGVCDYSYRVDCTKEPQIFFKKSDNAEEILSQDNECPLEFGTFRNKTNCGEYYTCAYNKVAIRFVCPKGHSFSDILGVCDYSYRVDCTKEPQIFQKSSNNVHYSGYQFPFNAFAHPDLSKPPAPFVSNPCHGINGLVRDKENCSSYYVCESGYVAANYVCPVGFKFSNEMGTCDQEERVNCDNPSNGAYELRNFNMTGFNLPEDVLSRVQNCIPGTVFRLNPECTRACRCRDGGAEIIECSSGLSYDSSLDKCVTAHLAKC